MSKRERVEDLGKILVLSNLLSDHEIFDLYHGRRKDIHEWWESLDNEGKEDFLHKISYGLEEIREKILEIWSIAQGEEDHA